MKSKIKQNMGGFMKAHNPDFITEHVDISKKVEAHRKKLVHENALKMG